jgi:hypothetical protein
VTLDVARRIASLLSNVLSFANSFISQNVEDFSDSQLPTAVKKGLTVRDRESLLCRRVHQCFTALGFSSIAESTQLVLLQSVVIAFSGTFSSVWQSADGYAYGVTFNEIVDLGGIGAEGDPTLGTQDYLNRDSVEVYINLWLGALFYFIF